MSRTLSYAPMSPPRISIGEAAISKNSSTTNDPTFIDSGHFKGTWSDFLNRGTGEPSGQISGQFFGKYSYICSMKLFVQLPYEVRMKEMANKPFTQWTLAEALFTQNPLRIGSIPDSSKKSDIKPLELVRIPVLSKEKTLQKCETAQIFGHLFASEGKNADYLSTVTEYDLPNLHVLVNKNPTKPNDMPHFIAVGYRGEKGKFIKCDYMVIHSEFGTGMSQFCEERLPKYGNFEEWRGCPEETFQASKALMAGDEELAKKILLVSKGRDAQKLGREAALTAEALHQWNEQSTSKLLLSVMCRLADPCFYNWMKGVVSFVTEHAIPFDKVLFTEGGYPDMKPYSVGLTGEKILEKLKTPGGFDELNAAAGPNQPGGESERNRAGLIWKKVYEFFREGKAFGFTVDEDWVDLVGLQTLFVVGEKRGADEKEEGELATEVAEKVLEEEEGGKKMKKRGGGASDSDGDSDGSGDKKMKK